MNEKDLAEALCIFNRIENLMRKNGAKGESFSDLVKSYNSVAKDTRLKPCQEFTKEVGHMFYFDRNIEEYFLKDDYYDETHKIEKLYKKTFQLPSSDIEEDYGKCKQLIKNFYAQKEHALDGFYPNLKAIGHERNQLLHIYNYKIENFKRFKKACYEIIEYFENKKQPFFGKTALNTKKEKASNYFWLKFILFIAAISEVFSYFHICDNCDKFVLYPLIVLGALLATRFFFPLLMIVFWLSIKALENIQAIMVLGLIALLINAYFSKAKEKTKKEPIHKVEPKSVSKTPQCNYLYVSSSALNIRDFHSSNAKKVSVVYKNEKLCISKEKDGWSYIDKIGWVASKYLSKNKN